MHIYVCTCVCIRMIVYHFAKKNLELFFANGQTDFDYVNYN